MPRPPALPADQKAAIVLAVLSGQITAAEAARTAGVSDQAIANWKRRFISAGHHGLEMNVDQGTRREQQLMSEIVELKKALGDSYLQLRAMKAHLHTRMPGPKGASARRAFAVSQERARPGQR